MYTRRKFLKFGLHSAFIVTAQNALTPLGTDFFENNQGGKLQYRFAIASDGHYGQPGTQYDALHDQMIRWINAEKASHGIDFTVINGDLFHDDVSFLVPAKSKWDQLSMPYYVSHGNHDQTTEDHWKSVWNVPWHFSFEHVDVGVIVLNTADDKGTYICPDVEWTKNELQKFSLKKHLFVCMHITPVKWTKFGITCPEVIDLFDRQHNLRGIFNGHDHDEDGVKENNGKHYFFDSHLAGNWGTKYNGYRIVEVFENGQILTYQMNPSRMKRMNKTKLKPV